MYASIHEIHVYSMYIQNWEYNRDELTYLRDIGEGHFGKVLLMRGKVESLILIGLPCLTVVHGFALWVLSKACGVMGRAIVVKVCVT